MNTLPPLTIAELAPTKLDSLLRRSLLMLVCVAGLPGCATLLTDDRQSIVVSSDPPGATCQVRQDNAYVATVAGTPGTVVIGKGRHELGIDCIRPGYYAGAAVLQPSLQEWTFGNLLFGGLPGLVVDTSTGAVNEYPHWITVMLKRQPLPGEPAAETRRLSEIETARQGALRERFLRK